MKVKLVVIGGKKAGMEIPVSTPDFFIGRGGHCLFRAEDGLVSRRHCAISVAKKSVTIEDCGSGKQTLLNGKRIQWRRELHDGDLITVGSLVLEVRLAADEESGVTQMLFRGRKGPRSGIVATDEDVKVVEWVEDEDASAGVGAHSEGLSSPLLESLEIQRAERGELIADVPSECAGQDRRVGRLDAQTARTKMDWIDLALLASIVVLGIVVVILLLPVFSEAGPAVRRVYRAVVRFRHWPWWIWTSCGVLLLGVLLWLRERFE